MALRLPSNILWYSTIVVVHHSQRSASGGTKMTTAVQPFAGTYHADPVHSSFGFGVLYSGTGKFRGTLDDVSATLTAGAVGLALEPAATVESILIREPEMFREHFIGGEFCIAENHPEVTFRST